MSAGWFAMSLHALALLAESEEGYTSKYLAGSVNTHSVFLRRVLSKLVQAGIVETREGRDGGYRLIHKPEQLTLDVIYRALEMDTVLPPSPADPNQNCPVGYGIPPVVQQIAQQADDAVLQLLSQYTIAQVRDLARQQFELGALIAASASPDDERSNDNLSDNEPN
ncbi:Rrf2 family transcriptional regulator [Paenibacillus sp. 481]|uniref:Rrf2 family transcriptional regulator n=1 Tax=Paenibacillus sp. 481 TaxID=2835869 RepID=UPI001E41F63F|nr:Rrf2 family transcriptional regulator [Paenibacillus sp. 481]UHA75253.1 Rrf2 family transcriptional regulator [Paenibacillus sp. 481]